jgi:hypothetical protein
LPSKRRQATDAAQQAADADAGRMLAADADAPHEAVDWRTAVVGKNVTKAWREVVEDRWSVRVAFGFKAAQAIARAARDTGMHPSAYVREAALAAAAAHEGCDVADLRENLSVWGSRATAKQARALRT